MGVHSFDRRSSNRDSAAIFEFSSRKGGLFHQQRSGGYERTALGALAILVALLLGISVVMLRKQQAPQTMVLPAAAQQAPAIEMIDVLVPIRTIEPGEELSPSLFATARRPRLTVPGNTALELSQVNGRFAKSYIPPFYPFTIDMLSEKKPLNEVIGSIPEGFRAVTINVNATSSVEGWARAGANVDVQWVTEIRGERSAKRLVENAKILSAERKVDSNQNPNEPIPTTVTLLVAEKEAQKISLAASSGHLVLFLRGSRDSGKGSADAGTLTLSDLIGDKAKPEAKVEGTVRIQGKNGVMEEMSIVEGKLQRKVAPAPTDQVSVTWAK